MLAAAQIIPALALIAQQITPPSSRPAPLTIPVVTVVASDFAYQVSGADSLRPGLIRFRLINRGPRPHQIVVSAIASTGPLERAIRLRTGSSRARDVGGPNMVAAGDTAEAIVDLVAGRYALYCWVSGADGRPHITHGMFAELIVPAPAGPSVVQHPMKLAAPPTGPTIRAANYQLTLDPPTLGPGSHLLRLENDDPRAHGIQVIRLAPGRTVGDVLRWGSGDLESPAPGTLLGGATWIDRGGSVLVPLTLTPGRYVIFCPVRDPSERRSHAELGMLIQVTVP